MAKKPVHTPEDLAGLKLRARTAVPVAIVKARGGPPVTLAAPETYNALERGVIDGTLFPWEAISGFKLAEVLRHHTVVNLYATSLFMTMNQKKYESLPPDLRKVIDDLSGDRKSTRLNSSHSQISYAVFCLKKKKTTDSVRSMVITHSITATTHLVSAFHLVVLKVRMLTLIRATRLPLGRV